MAINRSKIEQAKKDFKGTADWVIKGPTEIYMRITSCRLKTKDNRGNPFKYGSFFAIRGWFEEDQGNGYASLSVNTSDLNKHPILQRLIEEAQKQFDLNLLKGKEITFVGAIYRGPSYKGGDGLMKENLKVQKDYSDIKLYQAEAEDKNPQKKDGTIDWDK